MANQIKTLQNGAPVEKEPGKGGPVPTIDELAESAGVGTPESPIGAAAIPGTTAKQADMMGTPAQQQAAIDRQQSLPQQGPQAPAKTLTEAKRYEKPTVDLAAYEKSRQKAEVLSSMGPARTRIESLIESRLSTFEAGDITLSVNDSAIEALPFEQQEAARNILDNLIKAGAGSPEAEGYLQELYELVGGESLADVSRFFSTDADTLASFVTPGIMAPDTVGQVATDEEAQALLEEINAARPEGSKLTLEQLKAFTLPQLNEAVAELEQASAATLGIQEELTTEAGRITLGEIDVAQAGVDVEALAAALGLTADAVLNLTLEELNQRIAQVEQREFSEIERLQAELSSPTLTPQRQEAILRRLQELGAMGVAGAEASLDKLQEDLDAEISFNVAGKDYTLEQLMGDEGMSALIAEAVKDPDILKALKEDSRFVRLAEWIEENKTALSALASEYQTDASAFVTLQEDYSAFTTELGDTEEGRALLAKFLGVEELPESVTAADLEEYRAALETNPLYQMALEDEVFRQALVETEGLYDNAANLMAAVPTTDDEGNPLSAEDIALAKQKAIQDMVDAHDSLQENSALSYFFGDAEYITDYTKLSEITQSIEEYNNMDENVRALEGAYLKKHGLSFEHLADINSVVKNLDSPRRVLTEITKDLDERDALLSTYYGVSEDNFKKMVFKKQKDFDAFDIAAILNAEGVDEETKTLLLTLFDHNEDGYVSDEEINSADTVAAFKENVLGDTGDADADLSKIIKAGGDLDFSLGENSPLEKLGAVSQGAFETAAKNYFAAETTKGFDRYIDLEEEIRKGVGLLSATDLAGVTTENLSTTLLDAADKYQGQMDGYQEIINDVKTQVDALKDGRAISVSRLNKAKEDLTSLEKRRKAMGSSYFFEDILQIKSIDDRIKAQKYKVKGYEHKVAEADKKIGKAEDAITTYQGRYDRFKGYKQTVLDTNNKWLNVYNSYLDADKIQQRWENGELTQEELISILFPGYKGKGG